MLVSRFLCFIFAALLSICNALSQDRLALGTWRSHLASNNSVTLAQAGNLIYSGSPYSLFNYNTENDGLKQLSKADGFSQSDVAKLGYSEATRTLVIGYENGQMDLVKNNTIYPVNDIFNAKITGSKRINHLLFAGGKAWISTDFGLIVYNLDKREVTEVYSNFTANTSLMQVYSSSLHDDSIFVATSAGVFKAHANNNVNKLDYRSWQKQNIAAAVGQINSTASYKGNLYLGGRDSLVTYNKGVWLTNPILVHYDILNLCISKDKLWFLTPNYVVSYDGSSMKYVEESHVLLAPIELVEDDKGVVWVSDPYLGLVSNGIDGNFRAVGANGPTQNISFKLAKYKDKIATLNGGFDINLASLRRPGSFSIFGDGLWNNYSSAQNKNFIQCEDIVALAHNTYNNKMYLAAFGWGVIEWDGGTSYKLMNNKTPDCPLNVCNVGSFCDAEYPNPTGGGNYCKVEDLAIDSKGKVWVINHQDNYDNNTPGVLFSYDLNGKWAAYDWEGTDKWGSANYSNNDAYALHYLLKVYVDRNNTKWMTSNGGGVLAFNEEIYHLPRYMKYEKNKSNEICGDRVLSLAEDLDGAMWIGTNNGVCYFSDSKEVFQMKTLKASLPVFENRALLAGNQINAIEVDGGNRKWIGTATSGAWLFSSDGTSKILHFDQSNSPLPSDNILDIKINNKTGEVFFATDKGIFSYFGDAVLGEEKNTEVVAYPNPITQEFTGVLGISGLVKDAIVKITDISGQLVYQTKAQGSLASWNIKDYTGRRAQPGVYLIFTSKEDGSEALATKIAIID